MGAADDEAGEMDETLASLIIDDPFKRKEGDR
jgi:hypothetical protein